MNLCDSCNKFDAGCPWSRETPASVSVCCEHPPITRAQLSNAQAELAAVRGGAVLESLKVEEFVEICQEHGTDVSRCKAITELFRSRLRSAPEGTVLVDAGELEALRATIAKLKEFHDPVNVAKRIEEYAAQHKPAQREVVPNRTGGWFMEGDQGQRTTTAANASQHPGQGGKAGDHA